MSFQQRQRALELATAADALTRYAFTPPTPEAQFSDAIVAIRSLAEAVILLAQECEALEAKAVKP